MYKMPQYTNKKVSENKLKGKEPIFIDEIKIVDLEVRTTMKPLKTKLVASRIITSSESEVLGPLQLQKYETIHIVI